MVAERPSPKSLRLTAIDNMGKMKVYLVMARSSEINYLHLALKERIEQRKISHPDETGVLTSTDEVEMTEEEELVEGDTASQKNRPEEKILKKAIDNSNDMGVDAEHKTDSVKDVKEDDAEDNYSNDENEADKSISSDELKEKSPLKNEVNYSASSPLIGDK